MTRGSAALVPAKTANAAPQHRPRKGFAWLAGLMLLSPLPAVSQQQTVESEQTSAVELVHIPHVYPGTNEIYDYVVELLKITLDVTRPQYGEARLVADPSSTVQGRQLKNLQQQLLDLTWSVTSTEREESFQAIYVPLAAGLFGERILLINEQDRRFDNPLDLIELKRLRAVQGIDWPDTRILKYNGFTVVESNYESGFQYVNEGFVDYFPRSVLEAAYELKSRSTGLLKLEENLILSYPSVLLFFVARHNQQLAQRLEDGLAQLISQGEMQRLLQQQPFYQAAMSVMTNRTRYTLTNGLLSEAARQAYDEFVPLIRKDAPPALDTHH